MANALYAVVIDGNQLRQSILEALLAGNGKRIVVADDFATGLQAARDGRFDAILVFAKEFGEGIGDAMTNGMAMREAASESRLVVCLEPESNIEQSVFLLAGVDEILVGPFDPVATVGAMAIPADAGVEQVFVDALQADAA